MDRISQELDQSKKSEIRTCKNRGYASTSPALNYVRIRMPDTHTQLTYPTPNIHTQLPYLISYIN